MNSQSATSSGIPAISATPSPLPTNELSLLSPVPPKSSILNSASTQLNYLSSSSSLQSLKAQQSLPIGHQPIRRPKVSIFPKNGIKIQKMRSKDKDYIVNCVFHFRHKIPYTFKRQPDDDEMVGKWP
jgi:hypothetical protein